MRRLDDLGKQPHIELGGGQERARPRAGCLIVGVCARGIRSISDELAGEALHDVVLGHAHVAHARPSVGFVVAHPHDLLDRVGGVQAVPKHPVCGFFAEGCRKPRRLRSASRVGPDDRRSHGLVLRIEQHGAHHLTAHDEAGHRCGVDARLVHEPPRRFHDRGPPVAGVLFGDAARREVGGVRHGHRRAQPRIVVVQRGLVAGGAEIVGDDHVRDASANQPL